MRRFLTQVILIASCASASAATVQPAPIAPPAIAASEPDAEVLRAARDLLAVMFPPAEREKLFDTISNSQMSNIVAGVKQANPCPCATAVIDRFVKEYEEDSRTELHRSMPRLFEIYARAYARQFSIDELREIAAFIRTSTGSKYVQRGSLIMTDPEVGQWQRDEIAAQMKRLAPKMQKMGAEIAALEKSEGAK